MLKKIFPTLHRNNVTESSTRLVLQLMPSCYGIINVIAHACLRNGEVCISKVQQSKNQSLLPPHDDDGASEANRDESGITMVPGFLHSHKIIPYRDESG
jgi:hypothetical protein